MTRRDSIGLTQHRLTYVPVLASHTLQSVVQPTPFASHCQQSFRPNSASTGRTVPATTSIHTG